MKPSVNLKGSNSHHDSTKSRKSGKKKHLKTEKAEEMESPTKDGNYGQYAGIGVDSIKIYSEQTQEEELSDELCTSLAEDISYKLRQVINDALIKARLSGRNYISCSDLDETFNNLSIDKVYGATNTPNWIHLGDQNIYYLDDPCENLIEIAESDVSFVQCSRVNISITWAGGSNDVRPSLKKYFELICKAISSNDDNLKMAALKDLQTNHFIGPIVEWFYNFAYFLLSKNVTYDCLTLRGLDLIVALEENPIAVQTVSEKMLKLLTRLLLQRILRSITTLEVLKSICHVIYIFCGRVTLKEYVQEKLVDIKNNFPLSMVVLLNYLGKEAIMEVLIPHLDYFMCLIKMENQSELKYALLGTLSILQEETINSKLKDLSHTLVPFYKIPHNIPKIKKEEINWVNVKIQLVKSRRRLNYSTLMDKPKEVKTLKEVFSGYQQLKPKIKVVFHSIKAKSRKLKTRNSNISPENIVPVKINNIIIGKYSPFSYKNGYYFLNNKKMCYDHSLFSCSY